MTAVFIYITLFYQYYQMSYNKTDLLEFLRFRLDYKITNCFDLNC